MRNIFYDTFYLTHRQQLTRAAALRGASLLLYFLLYLFEDKVMELAAHGRWYFIVPIVIAFVYSFAHGNFTAHFGTYSVLRRRNKKRRTVMDLAHHFRISTRCTSSICWSSALSVGW